jgi:hypothetical protein
MRSLELSTTPVDLAVQDAPFQTGNSVVVINTSSQQRIVETSDASGANYATLATLAAAGSPGCIQTIVLNKQYVRTGAGTLHLLGN